jgi:hypothetical protein
MLTLQTRVSFYFGCVKVEDLLLKYLHPVDWSGNQQDNLVYKSGFLLQLHVNMFSIFIHWFIYSRIVKSRGLSSIKHSS